MRGTRLVVGLFALAGMLPVAACSHAYEASGDVAPSSVITLRVTNDNFLDMDVYAVAQGLATRVGTVTGNSARTFVLNSSLAAQDFRVVATPIGGNGRASSGVLAVSAGEMVDFRIGSILSNSSAVIR